MTTLRLLRVALVSLVAASAAAQCATPWVPGNVPGVAGGVQTVAMWDPDGAGPLGERLVIGGNLVAAGDISVSAVVTWDPATGRFAPLGAWPSSTVISLATHPSGDLVANGEWRWNGASWVRLGAGAQSPGPAVILSGGDVVAAQRFWYQACGLCPGGLYAEVRRWTGGAWVSLGPFLGFGANSAIYDLVVLPNGDLVVGGSFQIAGGVAANSIARWNGTAWSPLGSGTDGYVGALAVLPNGDLVAGGSFSLAGGVAAANVARWNGTAWSPLGSGTSYYVNDLAVLPNGELAAAGPFATAGGVQVDGMARWNGAAWTPFDATGAWHYYVNALATTAAGGVYAGGFFSHIGGAGAREVARFDGAGWSALWHGFDAQVEAAITLRSGDVVVGGDFLQADTVAARRVARWNGTSWSALGAGLPDSVQALCETSNGDVMAGIGDYPGPGEVWRWDGATWSPLGAGLPYPVQALCELPNGDLVAGIGNYPGPGEVWRWNGTAWMQLGPTMDGIVSALHVLPGGEPLAGGRFLNIGGVPVPNLARWDGVAWTAFAGGRPAAVDAILALRNGDLVVGGQFPGLGLVTRWDGTAWSMLGTGLGATTSGAVVDSLVELPDGDLVAAGWFTQTLGGATQVRNIARWDGAVWSPIGGGLDNRVYAMTLAPDGDLLAGGAFVTAGLRPSSYLARLTTTCHATAQLLPTACAGTAGPVTLRAGALPWVGSTFRSDATGFAASALAVSLLGLTSPNVPLTWLWPNTLPGCDQLASQEAILLHLPQAGGVAYSFTIPNDPVFAGLVLFHQLLQFELTPQGLLGPLSGSNGLRLTIGVF